MNTAILVTIPNEVSPEDLEKIHDAIEKSINCDVIGWQEKTFDPEWGDVVIYQP